MVAAVSAGNRLDSAFLELSPEGVGGHRFLADFGAVRLVGVAEVRADDGSGEGAAVVDERSQGVFFGPVFAGCAVDG